MSGWSIVESLTNATLNFRSIPTLMLEKMKKKIVLSTDEY